MKRFFLFFSAFSTSIMFAQTLPTPSPLYEATFNGQNWTSSTGFTIETTNISRTEDPFLVSNSAANLEHVGHGKIQLNAADDTTLRKKGTVTFFAKYDTPSTPPSTLYPIGNFYPIFYLNNGYNSWSEGLTLGYTHVGGVKTLVLKSYSAPNNGINTIVNNAIIDNLWHHYAITYQFANASGTNGIIRVYQDGKLLLTQSISHSLDNETKPFEFFGHTGSSTSSYKPSAVGAIDEIRVYRDYLFSNEIKDIYASYLKVTSGSKIAKYTFNDDFNEHFGNFSPITTSSNSGFIRYYAANSNGGGNESYGAWIDTLGSYAELPVEVSSILNESFSISFAYSVDQFNLDNTSETLAPVITLANKSGSDFLKIGMAKNGSGGFMRAKVSPSIDVTVATGVKNRWQHITFSADKQSNVFRIYINGSRVYTGIFDNSELSTLHRILIGIDRGRPETYTKSFIDDIVVDKKYYNEVDARKVYLQWKADITSYDTSNATLETNNFEKAQNNIKVFPNPTKDIVKLSEKADVQVYDVTGKLIKTNTNVEFVDLSTQKQGLYILKLTNSNGTKSVKVIKK